MQVPCPTAHTGASNDDGVYSPQWTRPWPAGTKSATITAMRVSVVGMGRVGTSVAFALIAKGLIDELCLANRTVSKAEGEAKDLLHASAFIDRIVSVRAGWLEVTNDSDVVVICASAPRPPHINSRLELGLANARLFDALVPEIAERSPNAILLIVTNPVDVLTYRALSCSGFDPRRVLGTGTLIDSAG